ncbi:MAG: hypothetical protein IPL39_09890 [Opitutaceae bacterium]|nr:hypothetical protein [Opitutaceae bacterium]
MKPRLPEEFPARVLERIEHLDCLLAAGGLYSTHREDIFTKVIVPELKALGFRVESGYRGAHVRFSTSEGISRIWLETASKVKVRKFGNRYMLDRHAGHEVRWSESGISRRVSDLWNSSSQNVAEIAVLVAYDSTPNALEKDLRDLERKLRWSGHGVVAQHRTWADPHGRGFHTGAYVWRCVAPAHNTSAPLSAV